MANTPKCGTKLVREVVLLVRESVLLVRIGLPLVREGRLLIQEMLPLVQMTVPLVQMIVLLVGHVVPLERILFRNERKIALTNGVIGSLFPTRDLIGGLADAVIFVSGWQGLAPNLVCRPASGSPRIA